MPRRARAHRVHRPARDAARTRSAARSSCSTIRADYYGRCAAYPELSAPARRQPRARHADAARRAAPTRSSARRSASGCGVEPELADALVADVEGEPGALPLLSTALLELWQQRRRRRLRHAAYERTGGVRGAVARLAEDASASSTRRSRRSPASMLLRLATEAPAERSSAGASRSPSSTRSAARRRARRRAARRPAPADGQRGQRGGRPRGAAARVAAPARLDRGGPRRACASTAA